MMFTLANFSVFGSAKRFA